MVSCCYFSFIDSFLEQYRVSTPSNPSDCTRFQFRLYPKVLYPTVHGKRHVVGKTPRPVTGWRGGWGTEVLLVTTYRDSDRNLPVEEPQPQWLPVPFPSQNTLKRRFYLRSKVEMCRKGRVLYWNWIYCFFTKGRLPSGDKFPTQVFSDVSGREVHDFRTLRVNFVC